MATHRPPVVPFYPFLEEGSPTKTDYRKDGYPYSILSTGGPRWHPLWKLLLHVCGKKSPWTAIPRYRTRRWSGRKTPILGRSSGRRSDELGGFSFKPAVWLLALANPLRKSSFLGAGFPFLKSTTKQITAICPTRHGRRFGLIHQSIGFDFVT